MNILLKMCFPRSHESASYTHLYCFPTLLYISSDVILSKCATASLDSHRKTRKALLRTSVTLAVMEMNGGGGNIQVWPNPCALSLTCSTLLPHTFSPQIKLSHLNCRVPCEVITEQNRISSCLRCSLNTEIVFIASSVLSITKDGRKSDSKWRKGG